MKKLIYISMIVLFSSPLIAQNTLPESVLKAIPGKYKVISNTAARVDHMATASLLLEIPNKFGCSDLLKGSCEISISANWYVITRPEINDLIANKAKYFKYTLPTAAKHTPQADPSNNLVKYSDTKTIELEEGPAVYYIATNSCIQDQYKEYDSVNLVSLQGSTAKSIGININGAITGEEAIAIVRELYGILIHLDLN